MTIPVLTFFNNKGGVGKTSLVYHLSWMWAELGISVLVVDCDPQANLTSAFLDEDALLDVWSDDTHDATTIYRAIKPLTAVGDIKPAVLRTIDPCLHLIPGDLALSSFEDHLSEYWGKLLDESQRERAFYVMSAFWRTAQASAKACGAQIILFDVGPNLGAINRSALISSDFIVVPLVADLFSLQGLRNLGPAVRRWRDDWSMRKCSWTTPSIELPLGSIAPLGYIALQHDIRLSRPVKAYSRWLKRIPGDYRTFVLAESTALDENLAIENDQHCLAQLKHYRSLMPMAQEARKPIFQLRPADGAIGAHLTAVSAARMDFDRLAKIVDDRMKQHLAARLSNRSTK
ncbi:MAG TPA: AAA family ATPase [Burkholderiaceae bacterium]|nr:AAA family ATPase [Burkholderiaceae bacterium]